MLATDQSGDLLCIPRAQIYIPTFRRAGGVANSAASGYTVNLRILPEVTDSKSAEYPDENIIGRSAPVKVYSHSGNRQIGWKCTFITTKQDDILQNYRNLRALQSAVYPDDGDSISIDAPYIPPPICKIRLGSLLTSDNIGGPNDCGRNSTSSGKNEWLSVVLRQYTCTFPVDVMWDEETYLPYRFNVDLTWDVIYTNTNLPGQSRIFRG